MSVLTGVIIGNVVGVGTAGAKPRNRPQHCPDKEDMALATTRVSISM